MDRAYTPDEAAKLQRRAKAKKLEDRLARDLDQAGGACALYVRQYRFHPHRKWPWDFAWPQVRLAVEVDGGQYSRGADGQVGGRHNRAAGYAAGCEKTNAGEVLGWHVLRFTGAQVRSPYAVETIRAAILALGR